MYYNNRTLIDVTDCRLSLNLKAVLINKININFYLNRNTSVQTVAVIYL